MPRLTKAFFVLLLGGIAGGGFCAAEDAAITIESLLREMCDRDVLARYPSPRYECLQASSYNRESVAPRGSEGWFADSDGIGFIREEKRNGRNEWVIMEHAGPGCVTKLWTPYFYYELNNHRGPKIRFYLDGADDPVIEEYFIELLTRGAFKNAPATRNSLDVPFPFAAYTARAGDLYLPVPFAKNCRITLDKKPFYNIVNYRAYPVGTRVESWSRKGFDAAAGELRETGDKLVRADGFQGGEVAELSQDIAPGGLMTLELPAGSRALRHLQISLGENTTEQGLRSTVLRMEFDGEETVWVPVGDFFCRTGGVDPFKTWEREVDAAGTMTCRWVMPYRESARVRLENLGAGVVTAKISARTGTWRWTEDTMHFHANWRMDEPVPGAPFQDWNFIDIFGRGVYVGDSWSVLCADTGWWGEGDEKIYIDGDYDTAKFPRHFGTGTEDYYGWAGGEVPTGADVFAHPFLANVRVGNQANPRGYNTCTRTRALDAIPFGTRLRFDMEASFGVQMRNPWDLLHYAAVTYWYAMPGASHNRPPLPGAAAKPVMTAEDLGQLTNKLRR